MKRLWITLLCTTLLSGTAAAVPITADSLSAALDELDRQIEKRAFYHQGHDRMLDSLRREMVRTDDLWKKYNLCGSLFYENLHYQADSSLYYVNQKEALIPLLKAPHMQSEIHINRAEVYGVMGLYTEALLELQTAAPMNMEPGRRRYYYSTCCSFYGWLADYTQNETMKQKYVEQTNCYRDSVLMLLPPNVDRDIVFSEQLLLSKQPDEVIDILNRQLEGEADKRQRTYLYYTLAGAYGTKGDTLSQMYYLARTAALDMEMCVREYAALPRLARLLFLKNDTERAHHYLNCQLQDAYDCGSRLRYLEGGEMYPIINRTVMDMRADEYRTTRHWLLGTGILLMLLIVAVAALGWWMKKLADMRHELAKANESLTESNSIKETYLTSYLDRCVGYMDKMEQKRRELEKLAMASKLEELFKAIKSTKQLVEERKSFYADFDRSFLALFPNFVERFNALLQEGEQVVLRPGELLNTELRIFALNRLGVTDANRIAHFLNCSLTTVYNYRSKMRFRAKDTQTPFEEQVNKL